MFSSERFYLFTNIFLRLLSKWFESTSKTCRNVSVTNSCRCMKKNRPEAVSTSVVVLWIWGAPFHFLFISHFWFMHAKNSNCMWCWFHSSIHAKIEKTRLKEFDVRRQYISIRGSTPHLFPFYLIICVGTLFYAVMILFDKNSSFQPKLNIFRLLHNGNVCSFETF